MPIDTSLFFNYSLLASGMISQKNQINQSTGKSCKNVAST